MSVDKEGISLIQDDSDDEFDWEEVDVPEHQPQDLEITLQLNPKSTKAAASNKLVVEFSWLRNWSHFGQEEGHNACGAANTNRLS